MIKDPRELVAILRKSRSLAVSCPNCDDEITLNKADLCTEAALSPRVMSYIERRHAEFEAKKKELLAVKQRPAVIAKTTRAVNVGKLFEGLFPLLSGFNFESQDCKLFSDPIDYLVFHGLSKGRITNIEFGDVKSGKATLTQVQKQVRNLVEAGHISLQKIEVRHE
jgi:predicted Holliday junction resolvase-like endonuclease